MPRDSSTWMTFGGLLMLSGLVAVTGYKIASLDERIASLLDAQVQGENLMLIKITYADGTSESFSGVMNYTNDGSVVRFHGTDQAGMEADWELNWALIRKVEKQ